MLRPNGQAMDGTFIVSHQLPGKDQLPHFVRRLADEADIDIQGGRHESALDLMLLAETIKPDLPLFLRHAELLMATGRARHAAQLAQNIRRLSELRGEQDYMLEVERILIHARPTSDDLVRLARTLLAEQRRDLAAEYIPMAVTGLAADGQQPAALELAGRWHALDPSNTKSLFVLARELLRAGKLAEALQIAGPAVARSKRDLHADIAVLAAAGAGNADHEWKMIGDINRRLSAREYDRATAVQLISDMATAAPNVEALQLHAGLIAHAAGQPEQALAILGQYRSEDSFRNCLRSVQAARAALAIGQRKIAATAIQSALQAIDGPLVSEFSRRLTIIDPAISLVSVGQNLALDLVQSREFADASELLGALRRLDPTNAEIASLHAEVMGLAGDRQQALQQLQTLFAEQERAGQYDAAIRTLQSMLNIAPANVALRQRLVDLYMRRGLLAEVVDELVLAAEALEKEGKPTVAAEQLRRGAEIAAVLGNQDKAEHMYESMIKLQPENIDLRHAAVAAFIQYGVIPKAVDQLREIVQISVSDGDPDEAIAALHQVIALAPSDPEAYHRLGELLSAAGEYAQAERVYRRLSNLLPNDPAVRAKQMALAALARESG